jgi:hypothetical protein
MRGLPLIGRSADLYQRPGAQDVFLDCYPDQPCGIGREGATRIFLFCSSFCNLAAPVDQILGGRGGALRLLGRLHHRRPRFQKLARTLE